MQAACGDESGHAAAPATANGAGEGSKPENGANAKRKKISVEEAGLTDKKRKKASGDAPISQFVVQALSKKGGTARLQKLLSMVTKKLAKQDAESVDKDATLAEVCLIPYIQDCESQTGGSHRMQRCTGF